MHICTRSCRKGQQEETLLLMWLGPLFFSAFMITENYPVRWEGKLLSSSKRGGK